MHIIVRYWAKNWLILLWSNVIINLMLSSHIGDNKTYLWALHWECHLQIICQFYTILTKKNNKIYEFWKYVFFYLQGVFEKKTLSFVWTISSSKYNLVLLRHGCYIIWYDFIMAFDYFESQMGFYHIFFFLKAVASFFFQSM